MRVELVVESFIPAHTRRRYIHMRTLIDLESGMNLTFLGMLLVWRNAFIVRPCSEIVGVKG